MSIPKVTASNSGTLAREAAMIIHNALAKSAAGGRTDFSREIGIHRIVFSPDLPENRRGRRITSFVFVGISPDEKTDWSLEEQIRSYVFVPYKLAKDHRSGVEVDLDSVLEGDFDAFYND